MADLPEVSEFTEAVRAFESTDPARYDVLNNALQPLVNRTKWLKDNMSSGGVPEAPVDGVPYVRQDAEWKPAPQSGGGSAPVEWIEGAGETVLLTELSPDTMYILDARPNWIDIVIPENHTNIAIGAEYHFVCAGDPYEAYIYEEQPV